jgi:hypothetical protein
LPVQFLAVSQLLSLAPPVQYNVAILHPLHGLRQKSWLLKNSRGALATPRVPGMKSLAPKLKFEDGMIINMAQVFMATARSHCHGSRKKPLDEPGLLFQRKAQPLNL